MDEWLHSPRYKRVRVALVALISLATLVALLHVQHGDTTGGALALDAASLAARPHPYNSTYPLRHSATRGRYVIAVIADMDKLSAVAAEGTWRSEYREGVLTRAADGTFAVEWTRLVDVRSALAVGGRGMELSALIAYNGELLTCDDRTGVVYSLHESAGGGGGAPSALTAIPRVILTEGDGETAKTLKCEWMAVRRGALVVGGFGKEFVDGTDGHVTSEGPMWVKAIDPSWRVTHVDWRANYRALRVATGTEHPAYLLHEAVAWHEPSGLWWFLPRRVSREPYDEVKDELRGSNLVLSVGPTFDPTTIVARTVGDVHPPRGFSCFKFLPDAPTVIVALKSVELQGVAETYLTVFDVATGRILLPETKFADAKFEGLEIIEG